jgi:hypothetical protein
MVAELAELLDQAGMIVSQYGLAVDAALALGCEAFQRSLPVRLASSDMMLNIGVTLLDSTRRTYSVYAKTPVRQFRFLISMEMGCTLKDFVFTDVDDDLDVSSVGSDLQCSRRIDSANLPGAFPEALAPVYAAPAGLLAPDVPVAPAGGGHALLLLQTMCLFLSPLPT